ncbi:MAG TPA: FtsL-like putative cell division protein [Cyclobacteriaceae bacterium]|nr:FtsL-like putative cell division protein [Cyclobacteriaceae bacterium]
MKGNYYKVKNTTSGHGSIFSWLQEKLSLEGIFDEGIPAKYIPKILFVTTLIIIYIGNNHYAEKTARRIEQLGAKVDELRADYTSMKADYMYASKQSEVAKKVKKMGLEENEVPPYKIIINDIEY